MISILSRSPENTLHGDGNHTTLFAKVLNASHIYAKITEYTYNPVARKYKLAYEKLYEKTLKKVEKMGFYEKGNKIMYEDFEVLSIYIPYVQDFNMELVDMKNIREEFSIIYEKLELLSQKNEQLRFLNAEWKLRICKFLAKFGKGEQAHDIDKTYDILIELYKAGYHNSNSTRTSR